MLNKLNARNYVPKRAKSGAKRQIFVEGMGRSAFSSKIAAEGEEKSSGLHLYGKDFLTLQPLIKTVCLCNIDDKRHENKKR